LKRKRNDIGDKGKRDNRKREGKKRQANIKEEAKAKK
jgi:hypothetical protein